MPMLSSMNEYDLMSYPLSGMNDVEVMGESIAGILEDLGAPVQAAQVRHSVATMKAARELDPNAVAVVQRAFKSVALMPLGIPPTNFDPAIPATLTQTIPVVTSRPMKPHQIMFPSTISPFFEFNATVAGVAQNSGAVLPCENYSSAAFRSGINWNTINTSTPLQLAATMFDTAVLRRFTGMLQGPTLLT